MKYISLIIFVFGFINLIQADFIHSKPGFLSKYSLNVFLDQISSPKLTSDLYFRKINERSWDMWWKNLEDFKDRVNISNFSSNSSILVEIEDFGFTLVDKTNRKSDAKWSKFPLNLSKYKESIEKGKTFKYQIDEPSYYLSTVNILDQFYEVTMNFYSNDKQEAFSIRELILKDDFSWQEVEIAYDHRDQFAKVIIKFVEFVEA